MTLTVAMQPSFDRQLAASTAVSAGKTEHAQLRNIPESTTVAQSAPLVALLVPIMVSPTLTPEPDPVVAANQRAQEGGNLIFILLAIAIIGSYFMTDGRR